MSLTENSNQVFLPAVREHGSFLYAVYKVIFCNFVKKWNVRHAVKQKYISQMSAIDVYD